LGGLEDYKNEIKHIKRMYMTGMGSSLHAVEYAEVIFKKLRCFDIVVTFEASEINELDFPLT